MKWLLQVYRLGHLGGFHFLFMTFRKTRPVTLPVFPKGFFNGGFLPKTVEMHAGAFHPGECQGLFGRSWVVFYSGALFCLQAPGSSSPVSDRFISFVVNVDSVTRFL